MFRRFLILTTFVLSSTAYAGVKDFDRKISLALVSVSHSYNLGLDSTQESIEREIDYKANTSSLSGFELTYKGFTIAYLTSDGIEESDIARKGDTSYEDIRGGLFFGSKKQWVVLAYYNRYKGFYLDNTKDVDPAADLYIQRADIETFNTGTTVMYIFNPTEFSAAAAYLQTAQQTDWGGSWIATASFDANVIRGEEDLIPPIVENDFGNEKDLREGDFATTTISVGYAYSVVWNKLFANLTVLFGRGVQQKRFVHGTEEQNLTANSSKFAMGYSLGYNGDNFYTGLSYVQDDNSFKAGSVRVSPNLGSSRLFIGFRF